MNELVAQRIVEILIAARKLEELTAGPVENGEISRAFWHIGQIAFRGMEEVGDPDE